MTNKYALLRNLAILCIVCNIVYWFFPFPPLVWRLAMVALAVTALLRQRTFLPCERMVLFFVVFNLFYFFIGYLSNPNVIATFIGNVLYGFLSLSFFSYLSEKGVMTEKTIIIISILLLFAAIVGYNHFFNYMSDRFSVEENITNGASEYFVMIIPLLFFIKKPVIKWSLLSVCFFFLLLGAKRGNIIISVIPLILIIYQTFKGSKNSAIKFFFSIFIIVIFSYVLYYWISSNDYLLYRIEQTTEGNSSNRDIIYAQAWNIWYHSDDIISQFFGYGYRYIYNQIGSDAHSDWLEILVDNGILGVILYIMLYVRLVRQIRVTKNQELRLVMIAAVSILFIKSIFSMSYNTGTLPLLMISFGTALGQYKISQAV